MSAQPSAAENVASNSGPAGPARRAALPQRQQEAGVREAGQHAEHGAERRVLAVRALLERARDQQDADEHDGNRDRATTGSGARAAAPTRAGRRARPACCRAPSRARRRPGRSRCARARGRLRRTRPRARPSGACASRPSPSAGSPSARSAKAAAAPRGSGRRRRSTARRARGGRGSPRTRSRPRRRAR